MFRREAALNSVLISGWPQHPWHWLCETVQNVPILFKKNDFCFQDLGYIGFNPLVDNAR